MEFVLIVGGVLFLFYVPYMVMASRRNAVAAALPLGRQLVGLDGLAGISCVDAAQAIVVRRHGDAQNLILTWDKVSSCDIIEESGGQQTETVASARRSGVFGRAVVGKLLGGNAGEVVGGLSGRTNTRSRSLTEEQVSRILCQIRFADVGLPEVSIRLYTDPYGRRVEKSSRTYQNAMDTARSWHALMEAVIAQSAGSGPSQVQATGTPIDRPTFPVPDEMRSLASAKCKQCGNDLAKNAATCPRCGARRRTSLRVWVIAGLAVILVGRCAVVSVRDGWDRDRAAARAAEAARQAGEQEAQKASEAARQARQEAAKAALAQTSPPLIGKSAGGGKQVSAAKKAAKRPRATEEAGSETTTSLNSSEERRQKREAERAEQAQRNEFASTLEVFMQQRGARRVRARGTTLTVEADVCKFAENQQLILESMNEKTRANLRGVGFTKVRCTDPISGGSGWIGL